MKKNHPRERPLCMSDWVRTMLKNNVPRFLFRGSTRDDYRQWRQAFEQKYHDMLGRFPPAVPLRPRRVGRHVVRSDVVVERIIIDSEPAMAVPLWVCRPRRIRRGQRCPAVVCCHGHGGGGHDIMGLDRTGRPATNGSYKDLGIQLARLGYVTVAPDWRVFGQRSEPPDRPTMSDPCNLAGLTTEHFGYHLLTLDIWDAMKTVDYLVSRPDVDPARIGCVGLSFGGTMSLHLAARDRRIRAACVSGYLAPSGESLKTLNSCGSQALPGLLQWGDRAELAGLICPRPLLIQIGEYDAVFPSPGARSEFKRLEMIYAAARAKSKVALDLFDGVHEINFPPVMEWFDRWLKSP